MAEQRSALDEQTLRETKADLTERIVDQAKISPDIVRSGLGVDPTSVTEIESYVAKVVRKAEVKHGEDRQKDALRVAKPRGPQFEGNEVVNEYAGTYGFGPDGAKVLDKGDVGPQISREGPNMRAARQCFAEMRELATQLGDMTWTRRIDAITCADVPSSFKDRQLKSLLFQYVQQYGDPRIKKERPVRLPTKKRGNPFKREGKRVDWSHAMPTFASWLGL